MHLRQRGLVLLLFLSTAGCDGVTKHQAQTRLRGREPVTLVVGAVELRYAENPGIAFNLERVLPAEVRRPLVVAGGSLLFALVLLVWSRRRAAPQLEHAAFAVLAGGALGNVIDRWARGFVIDFIHVRYWPVFNVADVAIVAGVLLLLFSQRRARLTKIL